MAAAAAATAGSLQEVTGEITVASAVCLNERPGFGIANLFVPDARAVLKSDDDDELLLILPFSNTLHLRFIEIESPEGEKQPSLVVARHGLEWLRFGMELLLLCCMMLDTRCCSHSEMVCAQATSQAWSSCSRTGRQ
jgi:hypothetical protein